MNTFGQTVAAWKGDRSLAEAALLLAVSPSTVHYWIRGVAVPPSTKVQGLAAALGVSEKTLRARIQATRAQRVKAGAA